MLKFQAPLFLRFEQITIEKIFKSLKNPTSIDLTLANR